MSRILPFGLAAFAGVIIAATSLEARCVMCLETSGPYANCLTGMPTGGTDCASVAGYSCVTMGHCCDMGPSLCGDPGDWAFLPDGGAVRLAEVMESAGTRMIETELGVYAVGCSGVIIARDLTVAAKERVKDVTARIVI